MNAGIFMKLGCEINGHCSQNNEQIGLRRFRSMFGVTPLICSLIWDKVKPNMKRRFSPEHLLWALLFLKNYNTEEVNRAILKMDEKTIRKHVWDMIDHIARLRVIHWSARKCNLNSNINASLDGVDFIINEPTIFDKKWYSFKHNGPGLRYEIGLCISSGNIVWAHGGKPCGLYSDLKLAREQFVKLLDENEKAIADKGYRDRNHFITPEFNPDYPNIRRILARHETVNCRLKQWKCLSTTFRHQLHRHPRCFHVIINIVQIMIENGSPLFQVGF